MSSGNLLDRFVIAAASISCTYLVLSWFLPNEDIKVAPSFEQSWMYHTNRSCELKPNGYYEFITDHKKFWMRTLGSMQSWRSQWVAENPYQMCSNEYQRTEELSLICKIRLQEMDDRWKRCYPIVKFKCKEEGFVCN